VTWDRVRQRHALSALGQKHLEAYAPRPTSTEPTSTRGKSRGGRAGRLITASFAVMVGLGLVAVVSAGSPWVRSYFADPVPTLAERPGGDAKPPVSQQTATAQSDEPATLFKAGATIHRASINANATSDADYTSKKFHSIHRKVRSHLRLKKHHSKHRY
jgi:hypothetical protein